MAGAVLILGAGAVASAFTRALVVHASPTHAVFGEILIWARRSATAENLVNFLDDVSCSGARVRAVEDLTEALTFELEVILFCVSDSAIEDLAMRVVEAWPSAPRAKLPAILHTSGFHGIEVLASLASLGLERGALHPAVSIAGLENRSGTLFEGVRFGVSGDPMALDIARELADVLGGVPLLVPAGGRALYHASAALLSGGIVALFGEAAAALAEAMPEAESDDLIALVRVLARSTVSNLESMSAAEALTGPVSRGDMDVVDGHLVSFATSNTPGRAELLRELLAAMLRLDEELG